MKKKMVSVFLTAAMISTMLAGCGSSSAQSSAAATSAGAAEKSTAAAASSTASSSSKGAKAKLTVAYRDPDDQGDENYMYKWIMQSYNAWDKKDQVELVTQPIVASDSDYFTKIQTEMQDPSTTPDLFFEDTFQLNTDVAAGYVANLDNYVSGWDEWNNGAFTESLKEGVKGSDGSVYAVPTSTDVRGLWYNKDVMEKAGLGRDWQPKSWQDILDACQAIKDNCDSDVVPIWFAASNTEAEATSMNTFEMLLSGTKDWLVDEKTGVWNTSSQGVKDSLNFIKTCKDKGYMGTMSEVFDASDWTYANKYMSTGKLGIYLNGSWGYADYLAKAGYPMQGYTDDTLKNGLGFAQMPDQNGGGYTTMSGGWSWAMSKSSQNQDTAFDFMKQMMVSDNYITYLVGSGNLSVKSDMSSYKDYNSKLYVEEDQKMAETAKFRPHNENYSKVSSYIYEMVDSIVRNDTSVDDAMSSFQNSVKSVVGSDKTK
jgi:multiple sugar transport system substrate-binding protein